MYLVLIVSVMVRLDLAEIVMDVYEDEDEDSDADDEQRSK